MPAAMVWAPVGGAQGGGGWRRAGPAPPTPPTPTTYPYAEEMQLKDLLGPAGGGRRPRPGRGLIPVGGGRGVGEDVDAAAVVAAEDAGDVGPRRVLRRTHPASHPPPPN